MLRFDQFVAIDWSGAKGSKHKGISVAHCASGNAPPRLVSPPQSYWSRRLILEWLKAQSGNMLIGFDFSFAPPFVERGAYFPGDPTPNYAKEFWRYVDNICDDEDLGAASLLEAHHRRHFYFGKADGRKSDFMHLRRCEAIYNAQGGGKPSTVFDVIGAAQVAKASFAGMRLLHHANQQLPIWPFDPLPHNRPLIIEIYTQIAARAAGLRKGLSKTRDATALDVALSALNSAPHAPLDRYDDHSTDALITSAWLRQNANNAALWSPPAMTSKIAQTEGWTFGVNSG